MPYLIMKIIHILAAVLFIGNIISALFWKFYAENKKDAQVLAFTFNGIRKSDRLFTMPGVTILILFGVGGALHGGYNLLTTGWILWSEILIVISAVAYMAGVVPAQKKISVLAGNPDKFAWDEYHKLARKWTLWAIIALTAPIIAVVLMTLKMPY